MRSGGSRGANPAMAPHWNWQWSLAPLWDRKSNGSIVILLKSKDFAPRSDVGYRFAPLLWKKPYKTRKRLMTKTKVIRNFGRYMRNFLGNTEMPKKGRWKMSSKIWPPVSEGLDPLVSMRTPSPPLGPQVSGYQSQFQAWNSPSVRKRGSSERVQNADTSVVKKKHYKNPMTQD